MRVSVSYVEKQHWFLFQNSHILSFLIDELLHLFHSEVVRNDTRNLEEGRLQDGVGAVAQANLAGNLGRIDDVHVDMVLSQVFLYEVRQMFLGFLDRPRGVVKESAVVFQAAQAVVLAEVGRHVNGHKVRGSHQVRSQNGLVAETEVRAGVAARFLRVVVEVDLAVFIGVIADDLDGVLVGTHRTVGTETVELGFESAFGQDGEFGSDRQ